MYLRRSAADRASLLREQDLATSLLAAALWITIKFEANRTCMPDANIMQVITGASWGRGGGAGWPGLEACCLRCWVGCPLRLCTCRPAPPQPSLGLVSPARPAQPRRRCPLPVHLPACSPPRRRRRPPPRARPAGVPADLLCQQECCILQDLQWDLMSAAREVRARRRRPALRPAPNPALCPAHLLAALAPPTVRHRRLLLTTACTVCTRLPPQAGAVGLPDSSGECCQDQQRQLALLALLPQAGPAAEAEAHARARSARPAKQQGHLAAVLTAQLQALPPAAAAAVVAAASANLLETSGLHGQDQCVGSAPAYCNPELMAANSMLAGTDLLSALLASGL